MEQKCLNRVVRSAIFTGFTRSITGSWMKWRTLTFRPENTRAGFLELEVPDGL